MSEPNGALLPIWAIYDHPSDFPEHVVVRKQYALRTGDVLPASIGCLYDYLEEARADLMPLGLYCLIRHPDDDPAIVETWF